MKKIITIIAVTLLFISCSSNDENEIIKEIPEKFNIKIELKANGNSVRMVNLSVNSIIIEKWEDKSFPFVAEYTYLTSREEVSNVKTSCNCITISASAYLSQIDEMQEFKLYIDGNLVDSTNTTVSPTNGTINATRIKFVYNY